MYEEKTEYALQAVNTKNILPGIYESEYSANKMRSRSADPNHWQIVQRKVRTYEWEELK